MAKPTHDRRKSSGLEQLSRRRMQDLRREIDMIDDELTKLLMRRLETACLLGELKRRLGLPVRDASREADVLQKIMQHSAESPWQKQVVQLFQFIVSATRRVQRNEKYGCQTALSTIAELSTCNSHLQTADIVFEFQ